MTFTCNMRNLLIHILFCITEGLYDSSTSRHSNFCTDWAPSAFQNEPIFVSGCQDFAAFWFYFLHLISSTKGGEQQYSLSSALEFQTFLFGLHCFKYMDQTWPSNPTYCSFCGPLFCFVGTSLSGARRLPEHVSQRWRACFVGLFQ